MTKLRNNKKYLATICAAIFMAFGAPVCASKLDGAQYLKSAKVSLEQARSTALKAVHGTIVGEELEKEAGGSGLRYSFDIRYQGQVHEVGIDAKTGKVLESGIENAADEAKEAMQEHQMHEQEEDRDAHKNDEDGDED